MIHQFSKCSENNYAKFNQKNSKKNQGHKQQTENIIIDNITNWIIK